MYVVLYEEGFIAALVERAGACRAGAGVYLAGVGVREPVHEDAKVAIMLRVQHEMPVVWHELIGEDAHARFLSGIGKQAFEQEIVLIGLEDGKPHDGTVYHMICVPADISARNSRHVVKIARLQIRNSACPHSFMSQWGQVNGDRHHYIPRSPEVVWIIRHINSCNTGHGDSMTLEMGRWGGMVPVPFIK